jgi:hypothetical protein
MASKSVGLLTIAFGANMKGFDRAMNKASSKILGFGNKLKSMGSSLTRNVTLPLVGVGLASVKMASDFEETDSKFKTVFKSLGSGADQIAKDFGQNFLLSERAAKQLLSSTGDLLVGFGLTEKEAMDLSLATNELAADLASFSNLSGGAEQASHALTSALLGEREAIKTLGIKIGIEDLKDYSKELGLTWDELSRGEQAALTLQMAMNQSGKAIGDVARTSGDFANQTRALRAEWENVAVTFGQILLPIASKMVTKLQDLAKWFKGLNDEQRETIVKVAGIVAIVGPLLVMLGSLAVVLVQGVIPALILFGKAMTFVVGKMQKNPLIALTSIVATLGVKLAETAGLWEKWFPDAKDWEGAKDGEKIVDDLKKSLEDIGNIDQEFDINKFVQDLKGAGDLEDAFTIDKDKVTSDWQKVSNSIKEQYLKVGGTSKELDDMLFNQRLGMLNDMKEAYIKHGEDTAEIDEQILDHKISRLEETNTAVQDLTNTMGKVGERVGNQLAQGAESFAEYGDVMKQVMKDTIGGLISQGVAAAVAHAMASIAPFPGSTFLIPVIAGVAAGLARTAFNSLIPSFAKGGIVSSPMLAMVGDAPSGPEVIAPLSDLKSMMGPMNVVVDVSGIVRGDDIWLSNSLATSQRRRFV